MENVQYVKRRYCVVLRIEDNIRLTRIKGKMKEASAKDYVVQYSVNNDLLKLVSVTNAEGPPVPIPNTEVKLCSGEDTLRETVRENSSMLTRSRSGEIHSDDRKKEKNYKPF